MNLTKLVSQFMDIFTNLYWFYNFVLKTKLENILEKERGRCQVLRPGDPIAQRGYHRLIQYVACYSRHRRSTAGVSQHFATCGRARFPFRRSSSSAYYVGPVGLERVSNYHQTRNPPVHEKYVSIPHLYTHCQHRLYISMHHSTCNISPCITAGFFQTWTTYVICFSVTAFTKLEQHMQYIYPKYMPMYVISYRVSSTFQIFAVTACARDGTRPAPV